MSEVKFVSMFVKAGGEKMAVDMRSFDKTEKTYNTYTESAGWNRMLRKDILALEEVPHSPDLVSFMEHLVDEGIVFRRWQFQIML